MTSTSSPCALRNAAVPRVAASVNPSCARSLAIGRTVCLSLLLTLMKTQPCSGSRWPALIIALAKAAPKLSAPPITSPVDFISGPRMVSTPGNRTKGNTGLFTNTPAATRSSTRPSSVSVRPAATRAAILDRKSTRLNSSHLVISYAVFCLKKKNIEEAAKARGAHEISSTLPDGYDTDGRRRRGRISAAERQLVAIARVVLGEPAERIIDEE